MIEQAKFTYSASGKAFEEQSNTIEEQGEKQIKALENRVNCFFVFKRFSKRRSFI